MRMLKLLRPSSLLLLLILATSAHGATYALLIGVDTYDDPDITPLRYTVNDVTAFRDVLIDPRLGAVPKENVVLLVPRNDADTRPTRRNILKHLQLMARRTQRGDTLFVYFAGHGMQTPEGQFLLGSDADPTILADSAVSLEAVPKYLKEVQADTIVVIIDACRNDPAAGRATGDNTMGEAFARSLRPRLIVQQAAENPDRHVATWLSCDIGQRAWEITAEEHGVFSYHLLAGLKGACKDNEGKVRLRSLSQYVEQNVTEWARLNGRAQTPRLDNPDELDVVLTAPQDAPPLTPGGQVVALDCVLKVTTRPPGAQVRLDEEGVGVTPLTTTVLLPDGQPKTAVLTVELAGYTSRRMQVTLEPGKVTEVNDVELLQTTERPPVQVQVDQPDRPVITVEGGSEVFEQGTVPVNPPDQLQVEYTGPMADWIPGPDGLYMASIPGGTYRIGRPGADGDPSEGPQHEVTVSPFQITTTEVNNLAYVQYLNTLQPPRDADGNVLHPSLAGMHMLWTVAPDCAIYFDEKMQQYHCRPGAEGLPVTEVTWIGAAQYALDHGMTLPTEAQWEIAAQGSSPNTPYPWGPVPDESRFNAGGRFGGLLQINAFPNGGSRWNVLNMVGNVGEWTRDYYLPQYHSTAAAQDPWIGETDDPNFNITVRGGSLNWPDEQCTIWLRTPAAPDAGFSDVGFRCVLTGEVGPGPIGPVIGNGNLHGERFEHPDTGVTFLVPDGYEHQLLGDLNVLAVVHNEEPDANPVFVYFQVNEAIDDHETVWDGLEAEMANLNVEVTDLIDESEVDTGNPDIELWRRVVHAESDGDELFVVLDAIHAYGRWHGLIFACPMDQLEDGAPLYGHFLGAIDFAAGH